MAASEDAAYPLRQQYRRQVEVSEVDVKGGSGTTFLPPSLLSKKSQPASKPVAVDNKESTGVKRPLPPKSTSIANIFRKNEASSKSSGTIALTARTVNQVPKKEKSNDGWGFMRPSASSVRSDSDRMAFPLSIKENNKNDSVTSVVLTPEDSQASYKPSKRAKMMSASATSGVKSTLSVVGNKDQPSKNSIILAALSKNKSTTLQGRAFDVVSSKPSAAVSKDNYYQGDESIAELLGCIICRENTLRIRGAAKCGHVCCLECWTQWLRKNQTCPLCRLPTCSDDISRIMVKR